MVFRGTVRNGKVELEPGAELSDGTRVDVYPATPAKRKGKGLRLSDLAIPMGISDLAAEHDHYLYGTAKKSGRSGRVKKRHSSATSTKRPSSSKR